MIKPVFMLALAGVAVAAAPAAAHNRAKPAAIVYDDSNPHYLDYKTDLSEARRELRKDLARADSRSDRMRARAEYDREVADAESDFQKEMAERGYIVRRGRVTVEEGYN